MGGDDNYTEPNALGCLWKATFCRIIFLPALLLCIPKNVFRIFSLLPSRSESNKQAIDNWTFAPTLSLESSFL